MRLSDISERVHKLIALSDADQRAKDDVTTCLHQFDVLADQRAKLVHRSIVADQGGKFRLTNEPVAKSLKHVETQEITRDDLDNMWFDAGRIFLRLLEFCDPSLSEPLGGRLPDEHLYWPWRYKRPAQKATRANGKSPRQEPRDR